MPPNGLMPAGEGKSGLISAVPHRLRRDLYAHWGGGTVAEVHMGPYRSLLRGQERTQGLAAGPIDEPNQVNRGEHRRHVGKTTEHARHGRGGSLDFGY